MPDFMILSRDGADASSIRKKVRSDHLDWLKQPSDCTILTAEP